MHEPAMHIAYVCNDLGVPIGGSKGASVHVRSLAQALAVRGHRISLLAANPGPAPPAGFLPRVHSVGHDRVLKSIKRRLQALEPDSPAGRETYALLLGGLTYQRLNALHRDRGLSGIYERHSLWSWAARAFAQSHRLPHVLEVNAPLVAEQSRYRELALRATAQACEQELIAGASEVVVPSAALAEHARRLGAKRRHIHLLPNAVDPQMFSSAQPLPAALSQPLAGKFVIAFVGSLKPWHGVESLLRLFPSLLAELPAAHLLVVGEGPLSAAVEKLASELGGERMTATGAVPHEEVGSWLHLADVGVAPYPPLDDFYFSPMKIVEYQAAGLAVVASDLGHIRRQIAHGETGLLVPAGDETELRRTLLELGRQPALARQLGRRARQAAANATWDQIAAAVERLLAPALAAEPAEALAAGGTV